MVVPNFSQRYGKCEIIMLNEGINSSVELAYTGFQREDPGFESSSDSLLPRSFFTAYCSVMMLRGNNVGEI